MFRSDIKIIKKKDLNYIAENGNGVKRFKPWLADAFSFLYDFIMKNSIFPKKFGGDIGKHYKILRGEFNGFHNKNILELATGTGSAVNFLPSDNQYTGTDISPGLLKKAVKKFRSAGFKEAEFYVVSADDLPFGDDLFDMIFCILSLNFIGDVKKFFKEIKRVAASGAVFICSVPVPERNTRESKINGRLYSEEELQKICRENGFGFESIPAENGAVLYFRAAPI